MSSCRSHCVLRRYPLGCYFLVTNLLAAMIFFAMIDTSQVYAVAVLDNDSVATGTIGENPVSEDLFVKARHRGMVRVIVQLRIASGSEETREQRIHSTQQGVLRDLAPVAHRLLRSYTAIPVIAIEASYDALRILDRSIHVLRVDEDGVAAPSIKPSPFAPVR